MPSDIWNHVACLDLDTVLNQIEHLTLSLPSGIDCDADPYNLSPDDAIAHVGGLIWKECQHARESAYGTRYPNLCKCKRCGDDLWRLIIELPTRDKRRLALYIEFCLDCNFILQDAEFKPKKSE